MKDSLQIKDQIIKNSFWNIINSFINRIGGFILVILLSRMLMPEGFGKYSLAMTIALFFITFSDLGINQTLIRYVSLEIDRDKSKARAYFKGLFRTRFLLTLSASLILLAAAYPLAFFVFHDASLFTYLLILGFYVFIVSLTGFIESLFFIRKNVKYISIKESVSLVLKIIAIIGIGTFIAAEFKLVYIFISFAVIALLAFFMNLHYSKKAYPVLFKKTKKAIDMKKLSRFIFLLNLQNISLMILSQATIIFLGIFLTSEYVGYYNAAWALVAGVISLLFSFSSMSLPIFTSVDGEMFRNLLEKIFRMLFIISIPVSFGLSLLSRFVIVAVYSYDYLPASVPLSILAFLVPCMIGIDLAIVSFSARNKQKKFSLIMVLFACLFILLNYLAIRFLSADSGNLTLTIVSIINLITWLSCFFWAAYLLKKELNVRLLSLKMIKPIISCLVMSAFILFSLRLFGDMNLLTGIAVIISSAIIYFLFLFLIKGITKEDFFILKGIIKKK